MRSLARCNFFFHVHLHIATGDNDVRGELTGGIAGARRFVVRWCQEPTRPDGNDARRGGQLSL
jgi:hypothetical protein